MEKILTAVKDHKTDRFGFIQTVDHMVDAERTLRNILDKGDNPISKYPQDFALYKVGTYYLDTGKIVPDEHPSLICNADSLIQ
jgi:hypothetical protein